MRSVGQSRLRWGITSVLVCVTMLACRATPTGSAVERDNASTPANAGSGAGTSSAVNGGSSGGTPALQIDCDPPPGGAATCPDDAKDLCGDGILTKGEACDDGNTVD